MWCCLYHFHNIKRIRKYLSRESTEMLAHSFFISLVDYCKSLLYGLPNYQLNKLHRVLNASARLVCNAPRFCHISPLLRGPHWLPVKARIQFKILLITFKEIHGLAPKYLCDLNVSKSHTFYLGARPWIGLNVISSILNCIRALTGSQCRPRRRGEMWRNRGALQTSLAEAFKTLYNLLSW